jgi:hypothetical protein
MLARHIVLKGIPITARILGLVMGCGTVGYVTCCERESIEWHDVARMVEHIVRWPSVVATTIPKEKRISMSERVRILQFEAGDVDEAVYGYKRALLRCKREYHTHGNLVAAEDLVNAIGEIYERARSRGAHSDTTKGRKCHPGGLEDLRER